MNNQIPVAVTIHVSGDLFLGSQFDIRDRPKTRSIGEFGLRRGVDRVLDVLRDKAVKGTFFVPGDICERYPREIARIADAGHEIASHGHLHENFANYSYAEQVEILKRSSDAIERVCGARPAGFRAPLHGDLTEDTLRALRDCGFAYSSSMFDDDVPYPILLDGQNSGLTEIPIKWPLYDLPYFLLCFTPAFPTGQSRVAQCSAVLENWKTEYEGAEKYKVPYVLMADTQTIAKPGRIGLLEELLDFIRRRGTGEFTMLKDMV